MWRKTRNKRRSRRPNNKIINRIVSWLSLINNNVKNLLYVCIFTSFHACNFVFPLRVNIYKRNEHLALYDNCTYLEVNLTYRYKTTTTNEIKFIILFFACIRVVCVYVLITRENLLDQKINTTRKIERESITTMK